MISTHPVLFNTIVVLFIAFTSGWLVSAINGKRVTILKKKVNQLKREGKASRRQIDLLQEQLQRGVGAGKLDYL